MKSFAHRSKRHPHSPWRGKTAYVFAASMGLWMPKAYSAVLVDLDATALPEGALASWNNTGTAAGPFVAPVAAIPNVTTVAGVKGVTLNGTSHYYTGPAAPVEVTGGNPRTIEAWIFNPAAADEETIFSWGRRGGGDGSNVSFNHGLNPTFGAVGHWGAPDLGWNGRIAVGRWTYVAYTYDGATARVYMDGEEANTEDVLLDTWPFDNTEAGNPLPFRLGSQNEADGTPTGNLRGSMTIAKLRVHDVAVEASQLKSNFDSQSISFGLGDQDNDQLPTWYENQYSAFLNPTDATDAAKDQDSDGLTNLREFQLGTRPDLADTDGDGLSDSAELNRTVGGNAAPTDPLKTDTDGDGLSDKVETGTGTFVGSADTGTDPLVTDSDGDTFSDFQEVASGSNPTNAASTPGATRPALVSLDSTTQELGPISAWPNTGSLGGAFNAPANGVPVVETVQGVKAVSFNGSSQYLTGPAAPAFVAGNSSRTVEAWILNPTAADEETIFSWGRRGGGDGSNASFNHGVNAAWGAVGHWGGPDIGWGDPSNIKQSQWTYVVYTYDGATQTTRVYADAVEASFEELPAPLVTHATDSLGRPLPFRVASQNEANGDPTGGLRGSMSIAEIRVFDRVLDADTISSNFNAGTDKFGLVDYDNDGIPTWYERQYGFGERNAADAAQDADSDGLSNLAEFQNGTLPNNPDTDGDGVNDGAEVNRAAGATNPLSADSDQDGLSDKAEADGGTDPLLADSDADGFADGKEVFHGSNPNLASSTPTLDPTRAIVSLDAASLTAGPLTEWPNSGPLGGSFKAAAANAGTVETVAGAKGVTFDGVDDSYVGPIAPAFLAGNGSRSVDAWVFNPAVNSEESIIAWGRRGGPDGSNASYTHGTDTTFGAMGQWGAGPDVGWGTGTPVAGQWTHLAYVYDGPTLTASVYKDGVLANTEVMSAELAIWAVDSVGANGRPLPFRVGAQNNADGSIGGQLASLTVAKVRVYDQALSAANVTARYEAEKGAFAGGTGGGDVEITEVSFDAGANTISLSWAPVAGRAFTVESSPNLSTWSNAATGVTTGQFSETVANAGAKYYRLKAE